MTVGLECSSWPPPHRVLASAGQQILPPRSPQGSRGHIRVGDGRAVPTPFPSLAPWWASVCSYALFSPGVGTRGSAGALRWRVSPPLGGPEDPEVTEPSRLVGESSGGEVRKQQLDTRVRQEPPGGPVSGAGSEARGLEQALEPRGDHGAARAWAPASPAPGSCSFPFCTMGYQGGAGAH